MKQISRSEVFPHFQALPDALERRLIVPVYIPALHCVLRVHKRNLVQELKSLRHRRDNRVQPGDPLKVSRRKPALPHGGFRIL